MTSLVPFVEVCEDTSNQLSLVDIENGRCAFDAANASGMSKGFTASDWWMRVRVHNSRPESIDRWFSVGHPKVSLVQLYSRGAGTTQWQQQASGLLIPAAQRPVLATTPVLPVRLEAGQELEILVRVSSKAALDISLHAWESHKYMAAYQKMQLANAVALGGLLLTGLFALAIFFQYKDQTFLYYGLAMWCEIGVELVNSGVWPQYLWPEGRAFALEVLPVCVAGAVVGFTLFLHSFIGDLKRFPVTLHLFHASVAVLLAGLLWAALVQYRQGGLVWSLSVVVMLFFSLALIAQAAWNGSRQARLLMVTTLAICLLELFRLGVTLGLKSITITMIASAPWAFVLTAPAVLAGISRHSRDIHEKYLREKQTTEIRSQLLARVGHDLRAPLTTILGFSRMLENNSARTTPREAGAAIARSGQILLRQIDDLLDLARLEVGQLRLLPQPVVLATWLEEMRINAELMSLHAGNRFCLEAEQLPRRVLIDADRLNQVLTNLLSNANRATSHGVVTLTCAARTNGVQQSRLFFAVADTGVGIAAEDQARIFAPFEQGGGPRNQQASGIGLGLAIVRNLVEMMGGHITVTSAPGAGTQFEFSIDCALLADADGSQPLPITPPEVVTLQATGKGKCILVADDNAEDRLSMQGMLKDAGYRVVLVEGALQATEAKDLALDAVVTDQYMSDGSGWQVLEALKQSHPNLPVILVSQAPALAPSGWKDRIRFDATLTKPVDPKSLLDVLQRVLDPPAAMRPPDSKLAELRKLIQAGEITLIDQWARALKASHPTCGPYAEQVSQALLQLDFDRLRELSLSPP
ncbi:ATP-binding protein [Rubrivivax sp. A210]|uniref:hybrid sensor histidine kinase/response regulator n=1 Tax=Rubrivivax sp. A210 TaxID=2772301 RepID=UPI00191AF4DC|nr:ATP-binding protein [Rubrivivax sp. A210]